MIGYSFAESS